MPIITRTSPRIFSGASRVMQKAPPTRPQPTRRPPVKEMGFLSEKAKLAEARADQQLRGKGKMAVTIDDIVMGAKAGGLTGGQAVAYIEDYVDKANRSKGGWGSTRVPIAIGDMGTDARSWYDKQVEAMAPELEKAAADYAAWKTKKEEFLKRPPADWQQYRAILRLYPSWSDEYKKASRSYGAQKKKKHEKAAETRAGRMEDILAGKVPVSQMSDAEMKAIVSREERMAFKGTQEEYKDWLKEEVTRRLGISAAAQEAGGVVTMGFGGFVVPETEEQPAIIIRITADELKQIEDAKARGECEGTITTYFTVKQWNITTPDGQKIVVEALTLKDAKKKAEDAGYKIAWAGRRISKAPPQGETVETGAYKVTTEDGKTVTMVPLVDSKTNETMLIAKDAAETLKDTDAYKEAKGTHAERLGVAYTSYSANIERVNDIVGRLEPYKDGGGYDLVTPLQRGVVTGDELQAAGFDPKTVKGVVDYVTNLRGLITRWDQATQSGGVLEGMTMGEQTDFATAIREAGLLAKYDLTPRGRPTSWAPAGAWQNQISEDDKYKVAEIYASYPAAGSLLSSVYRNMVAEAPDTPAVVRVLQQVGAGTQAAAITPFVKEQGRANLELKLKDYKADGGYDITKYLEDNPENGAMLLNNGVALDDIKKAQEGGSVVVKPQGATAKDWAVAGLMATTLGAGGASTLVAQPLRGALLATSGLATLGLGGIATADTVAYWNQMDNTDRGIAIAFDVVLLTSGILATKAGVSGFRAAGGPLKVRNALRQTYWRAKDVIKQLFPSGKQAAVDTILGDINRAMATGDAKLLQSAAKRLELAAGDMPAELRDGMVRRAQALQAAPDNWIKLADKQPPPNVTDAIKGNDSFIKNCQERLANTKDSSRYNTIQRVMEEAMRQREKLVRQATKTATKTKVDVFEQVEWETGKNVPAKAGAATKAVTRYVPAKVPATIPVGKTKTPVPVKDLTTKPIEKVAKTYGVAIWDITRATRKLPKGVLEEIALINPLHQSQILADAELQRSLRTAGATRLMSELRQQPAITPRPEPQPKPEPYPLPAPRPMIKALQQTRTKTKEKPATAPYPLFLVRQSVQTRHKRYRPGGEPPRPGAKERLTVKPPLQSWRQGAYWVTIVQPFRTSGTKPDVIFSRQRPPWGKVAKGRGSPQATLLSIGKVPQIVRLPMGKVVARVKRGKVLRFSSR